MDDSINKVAVISVICIAISAILGIIIYIRQQKINRLQNLISVFQRFANNDDFILIFNDCHSCYVRLNISGKEQELTSFLDKLKSIDSSKKYKYLALLEEIAILSKNSAIIRKHAIHLFKFHFYYVYGNDKISSAFWANVGSGDNEKNKEGWGYQSDFAKNANLTL